MKAGTIAIASLLPLPSETATQGSTPPCDSRMLSLVLQDISFRCNVIAFKGGNFNVPAEVVSAVLQACRSRTNLAARLAVKVFSAQERSNSNCQGGLGKTALDGQKLKGIYSVCMWNFPLK